MGIACDASPTSQELQLGAGWNMISSYVHPDVADLSTMLAPIQDQMVLLKNGLDEAFWPALAQAIRLQVSLTRGRSVGDILYVILAPCW
jgi:hypothetical protein